MNSCLKNQNTIYECEETEFKLLFENSFKCEKKEFDSDDDFFYINTESNSDHDSRKNSINENDIISLFLDC